MPKTRRFIVRYKGAYGKIRERLLKEKTAEKLIRNRGYRFNGDDSGLEVHEVIFESSLGE